MRPWLGLRRYDAVARVHPWPSTRAEGNDGRVCWRPAPSFPAVVAHHDGEYLHAPLWREGFDYPVDRARGKPHREDLWSPGELVLTIPAGGTAHVILSADRASEVSYARWRALEAQRRQRDDECPESDPLVRALWRVSNTFTAEMRDFHGLVAGYPWFGPWGRDCFTSLTGLCIIPGRYELAKEVIATFVRRFRDGLLPNVFDPESGAPRYNTLDGALWLIHALGAYVDYTGDLRFAREVAWPAVRRSLRAYRDGTSFGIQVDSDGLVRGGSSSQPLTWMDAVTEGHVHTPRRGKPVEIQALWIHALEISERLAHAFGENRQAISYERARRAAVESFCARFWCASEGWLYDMVDGDDGDAPTLRPNQIFALSLTPGLLDRARALRVLEVLESHLLTPFGLRSLDPGDARYRPRYEGDQAARDAAYHQGTVWPFLLGPFVKVWLHLHGRSEETVTRARGFFDAIEKALREGAVDHLSEIFDGDPPHTPRGCIAQAWSNAEILQTLWETVLGHPRPFATEGSALRARPWEAAGPEPWLRRPGSC